MSSQSPRLQTPAPGLPDPADLSCLSLSCLQSSVFHTTSQQPQAKLCPKRWLNTCGAEWRGDKRWRGFEFVRRERKRDT
uniref:Uncharacterized protein n=1 Tax=Kalanchoe fedtschenkoi TaxID=63787 RepID=A0A7N0T9X7_KALFE